MNKPGKSSIFKASLLVALLSAAFGTHAAGLGKLSVYSAIGQPLNAEAALTASPDELSSLSAKLASHDAFREAGIDFAPVLRGLRFSIAKSAAGQPILRLTTEAPLNEPFLHFLVELNWTSGRMVREYTFLLDPPELLQAAKPVSVVKPVAPAQETSAPPPIAKPLPAAAFPAKPMAKPAARPGAVSQTATTPPAGGDVRVKTGDTLSKIARENLPEAVSLDQMLVALFNANREVFDGNNMNRLRAGKILRLPDSTEAAKVDPAEARTLIVSQAADFNAYRRRLADAVGAAPATEVAPQQGVAGKIAPQVEAKAPPLPAKDKLEVSRTETAKAAKGDVGKIALEEELIARDKALREAADRIAHLEKNLENLKQLVELKSEGGAQLQQKAQAAAAPVAEAEKKVEPSPAKPVEVKPADAATATQPVAAVTAEPQAEPAKPAVAAPEPAKAPPPKPAAKKPVPPPPPPPEPSFVEDNPELVYGGGGVLALLLGYFGYTAWRKKKQTQAETEFVEPLSVQAKEEQAPEPTSMAASVVGQAVDQPDVSIMGDFSESGPLTAEGSVDPVAEADVLMAYGRDGQAEEILLEGIKAQPQNTAIHAKLLELYANRGDTSKFEATARKLHDVDRGQGEAWDQAVALAAGLGLTGGVFAAATAHEMPVSGAMTETAAPSEEEASAAAEGAAMPQAQETAVPTAEAEETSSLDFDLDLGTTTGAAVTPAEPPAAQPAAEEVMSLDFDFDLGTPEPAPAGMAAPAATEPAAESNAIDFALDIGEPSALAAETAPFVEPAAASAETNAIDFDLDLGSIEPAGEGAGAVAEPPPALDLADISLDLEEPSSEPEAAETSSAAEMPLADLDLDIGLDLEEEVPLETPTAKGGEVTLPSLEMPAGDYAQADEEPVVAGGTDEELSMEIEPGSAVEGASVADDPEVATKLELAQAYEEMGDHEGARELLNEVLNEGSATQQALARTRLEQIGTA